MGQDLGNISRILSVIADIEIQPTADTTFNVFRDFTRELGGSSLLIGQMVNPILEGQSIMTFGRADWDPEWQQKWVDGNYILHDPISQYAMKTRQTFRWDTAYAHATEFGKKILEEGRNYSSPNGIAIPVTAGHLPPGIISIGFDKKMPEPDEITLIEMVAIHCYTHLLRLLDTGETLQEVKLTKRETEILNYVAAGKTNWEISQILGRSEYSIAQHMKNISKKMNATNRAHAVTIGIKTGQIIA